MAEMWTVKRIKVEYEFASEASTRSWVNRAKKAGLITVVGINLKTGEREYSADEVRHARSPEVMKGKGDHRRGEDRTPRRKNPGQSS